MTHDKFIENLIGLAFVGLVVASVIVGVVISFVAGWITYVVCQRIKRVGEVWRDMPVDVGVRSVPGRQTIMTPDGKICGYEEIHNIVDSI
jgi:hypothetical protein